MKANPPHALDDPRFRLVDGRTRPEFMLVGGAKCGSTSFARYLEAHPQINILGPKEPNYWSWRRYPIRYQDFFVNETPILNPGPEQFISGEFSTSSLMHPLVPRRVQPNLPNLKIFVLLRNPVDRAYSHFMMAKRAGQENECSFEEIVRQEMDESPELLAAHERGFLDATGDENTCFSTVDGKPICIARHKKDRPKQEIRNEMDLRSFYVQSLVFRSLYHDQVHRWLRLFPRQQIMIIQSETFFENEAGTMNEVAEFLGLEPFDFHESSQVQRRWDLGATNVLEMPKEYSAMEDNIRKELCDFFEPFNQQLYRLIDKDFGWN